MCQKIYLQIIAVCLYLDITTRPPAVPDVFAVCLYLDITTRPPAVPDVLVSGHIVEPYVRHGV